MKDRGPRPPPMNRRCAVSPPGPGRGPPTSPSTVAEKRESPRAPPTHQELDFTA